MNILSSIKNSNSSAKFDQIARFVENNPSELSMLIAIFLEGPYRITQHASSPLHILVRSRPEIFQPYLSLLVNNLLKPSISDAVKRNTLRLFQFIECPSRLHAKLINHCFNLLKNKKEPIAVRVFCMTVLFNLTTAHPAIKGELIILIEDMMAYGSAGIVARGKKILKLLKAEQY